MDKLQSKTELIQKLRDIINYLSNKTPYSINFNDADEYEYEIEKKFLNNQFMW